MSTEVAHERWWQTFEVICGIPFLVGAALQVTLPSPFARGLFVPAGLPVGVTLVLLGLVLIVLARRELARHGQPTDPGRPTSRIVTTGVFAISRNPLYLGGFCVLAGIALAFSLVWALLTIPLTLIACNYVLIAPEERFLATRFGAEYRGYAASVRRWIGRRRRR